MSNARAQGISKSSVPVDDSVNVAPETLPYAKDLQFEVHWPQGAERG